MVLSNYYHSQIDMEILLSGVSYKELPDTYVIFICDFDPFGKGKYRYTRKCICKEVPEFAMDDGAHTVFLSSKGTNADEVPEELVKFLQYVGARPSDCDKDYNDAFIRRLQASVREVKASREMGAKYMTFQELLKDEREAGREEGREEGRIEMLERQVRAKLARNESVEKIADDLVESIEVIQQIVKKL